MPHIAESTHWYAPDGSPAYEVKSLKGGMRPTTLRDARKLGLVPSVTSIIKCAAAPGLEHWKRQQVLMAALTLPRMDGEPETDWLERVMRDSGEQARKAAERGTAIHAAIQGHYEGTPPAEEFLPHVKGTAEAVGIWADAHPFNASWDAERSFCHPSGFGGKTDLSCDGRVIDFKSKEFSEDTKLDTYDEHHMQLASYREGLNMPSARCAICYVSVTHPGLSRVIEIAEDDLQRGWNCFTSLLEYWKAKNRYDPLRKAA